MANLQYVYKCFSIYYIRLFSFCVFFFILSDHNHPTSPLLAKPPELSEEAKLTASMKFVAANTVGEWKTGCSAAKLVLKIFRYVFKCSDTRAF